MILRRLVYQATIGLMMLAISTSHAQSNPNTDNGIKPFGSYDSSFIGSVDLATGGLIVDIPLVSFPQRGNLPPLTYKIHYGSKMFSISGHCLDYGGSASKDSFSEMLCTPKWNTPSFLGVSLVADSGALSMQGSMLQKNASGNITSFTVSTEDGTAHPLFPSPYNPNDQLSGDGSGYVCHGCIYYSNGPAQVSAQRAYSRNGIHWSASSFEEDPNGNQWAMEWAADGMTYTTTDTLGRTFPGLLNPVNAPDPTGCAGDFSTSYAKLYNLPGYSGKSAMIKECHTFIETHTAFNDSSYVDSYGYSSPWAWGYIGGQEPGVDHSIVPEAVGESDVIQTMLVYDGNSWTTSPAYVFHYNLGASGSNYGLNGYSPENYGDLTQIDLPTGGWINYQYGTSSLCSGIEGQTDMSRVVTQQTRHSGGGSPDVVTTYQGGNQFSSTVTVSDGLNTAVHQFGAADGTPTLCNSPVELQAQYYSGSGSKAVLQKTVKTDYIWSQNPYQGVVASMNNYIGVYPIRTTTTLSPTATYPNGAVSKVETDYQTGTGSFQGNTYVLSTGNAIQKREYDWGNGAPGALIRCTATNYMAQAGNAYMAANLLDLPASVSVYSGACNSGTLVSQKTFGYDEQSLQASGVSVGRDPNASSLTVRGNRTSSRAWLNTTGGTISTSALYYDTGMPYQSVDANGNTTTYTYSSQYAGAYLTETQLPNTGTVSHTIQAGYDFNTGLMTSFTDQNSQTSTYNYDLLGRIGVATFPDKGYRSFTYPSFATVQETTGINSSTSMLVETDFDGLGRLSETQLLSDPGGPDYVTTTYNKQGQKCQVSNPARTPSSITCSSTDPTVGVTTYSLYDGLGRLKTQIDSDGVSTQSWTYNANVTTYQDENGHQWQRAADALGRLTQVVEPGSYTTNYIYDTLNNLLKVNQLGNGGPDVARSRTFNYDSLSRLLCASNPENTTAVCPATNSGYVAGTTGYSYDGDGNVNTKTDARGVVTTYAYDALNRLYAKTYSPSAPAGTLSSCYQFDTAVNGIGRLGAEWTQSGQCSPTPPAAPPAINLSLKSYGAYDAMGRVQTEQQCAAGFCTTNTVPPVPTQSGTPCNLSIAVGLQYCYDLAGNLVAYSNGLTTAAAGQYPQHALLFSQTFDGANRLNSVSSSWSDPTHPSALFSAPTYTPFSALSNWQLGTQLMTTRTYDNRLRVTGQSSQTTP